MAIDRYLIQRAFFLFLLPPQLEKANGFFKVSNESRPWTRIHSDEIGEIRGGGGGGGEEEEAVEPVVAYKPRKFAICETTRNYYESG